MLIYQGKKKFLNIFLSIIINVFNLLLIEVYYKKQLFNMLP